MSAGSLTQRVVLWRRFGHWGRMASESQPAPSPLRRHATWLALARASFGVPAAAPEACLRRLVALGALADIGDSAVLVRELLRRSHVEPGALVLLGTGLSGTRHQWRSGVELQRFFRGA